MEMANPVTDIWRCPDGMAHVWAYLGKQKKAYRCVRCAETVTKDDLKTRTD